MARTDQSPKAVAAKIRRVREQFQLFETSDLISMEWSAREGLWLSEALRDELAARGVDNKGTWVGFPRAAQIWCRK